MYVCRVILYASGFHGWPPADAPEGQGSPVGTVSYMPTKEVFQIPRVILNDTEYPYVGSSILPLLSLMASSSGAEILSFLFLCAVPVTVESYI